MKPFHTIRLARLLLRPGCSVSTAAGAGAGAHLPLSGKPSSTSTTPKSPRAGAASPDGRRQHHHRAGHRAARQQRHHGRHAAAPRQFDADHAAAAVSASTPASSAPATAMPVPFWRPNCARPRSVWRRRKRLTPTASPRKQGIESRNYQRYLDRVAELKAAVARAESDVAGIRRELGRFGGSANRGRNCRKISRLEKAHTTPPILACKAAAATATGRRSASAQRFQSLDLLATLVAVVRSTAPCCFANAALEDALGMSRRSITGALLQDCFTEPAAAAQRAQRRQRQRVRRPALRRLAQAR